MKIKLALTTFVILFWGYLKAQDVTVSNDNNRVSFVITNKTTKPEIQKADSVFSAHNISTSIKASWKKGHISNLNIVVDCAQGHVKYHTASPDNLKKGVIILVDKNTNAATALSVGTNTGKQ